MSASKAHTTKPLSGWRAACRAFLDSDDPLFFRAHMLPDLEKNAAHHREIHDQIRGQVSVHGWANTTLPTEVYALSRLHDLILCHLGPADMPHSASGWFAGGLSQQITPEDHARFVAALGFDALDERRFCPVFHEVVALREADDSDAPPRIVETLWPCLTIGKMLFARAGVVVEAGKATLPAHIATGPLFWSWARRGRDTHDLSDGWGSNSQWGTHPRIDIIEDNAVHMNTGTNAPTFPTIPDDQHLLLHRVPLSGDTNPDDLWPYDLTATYIRRTNSLVPRAPQPNTPYEMEKTHD